MTAPVKPYTTSTEGLNALHGVFRKSFKLLIPPAVLSLSEWADRFAYIPKEAGAFPGKFQTSFAEYQRDIMDTATDADIETVVQMLPSQTGKTQIQLNTVGFFSHWEPSPILFVQDSLGEAEKFSKNRVAKMIAATPVLRRLFPSPRSRDSGNTLLNKEFPGGVLVLAGANAPAGLASMPIRILLMDEVDRYDESAGTEGDPVDLATKRTTTFWNRKVILASTPGVKHMSRIETAYEASDKRRYYVPCPHCKEMQVLEWPRLRWVTDTPTDPDQRPRVVDFFYVCVNGCEIRERSKHEMIRRGVWRATQQSIDGKTAGFHLNALYSPVLDWGKLIHEWLEAQGSLERMKTFVNTRLAETWEIRGTGADLHELEKRKETYSEVLPEGVLFLTAGVDVQDDRIEASKIGWGMDDERWVIDHEVFQGDPSLPESDARSPWARLGAWLLEDHEHALGIAMHAACALIDSGGHNTEAVYQFTRKYELRRWHAIVGRAGIGKPLASSGNRVGPNKTMLYTVGVDTAKEDIFTSFRVEKSGPGYCHFSASLEAEYFRQVTAEKLVKTKKDFVTTLKWIKTGERNEALDCFVYARAAVAVLRPNFRKIAKNMRERAEEIAANRAAERPAPELPPEPVPEGIALKTEEIPTPTAKPLPRPMPKPRPSQSAAIANQLRRSWNNGWK